MNTLLINAKLIKMKERKCLKPFKNTLKIKERFAHISTKTA